jgi:hypothetical protein
MTASLHCRKDRHLFVVGLPAGVNIYTAAVRLHCELLASAINIAADMIAV